MSTISISMTNKNSFNKQAFSITELNSFAYGGIVVYDAFLLNYLGNICQTIVFVKESGRNFRKTFVPPKFCFYSYITSSVMIVDSFYKFFGSPNKMFIHTIE